MSKNKNYSLGASSPIASTVAFALGKKDAVEDSLKLSRETAQKDYRFHTPALENDKGEDTLRHILGGGFLSEGEDDNFFEKTGAKVATALYNYKERNVNSPTRAGMESSIDLNNNIYGALLKKKYPNKEDFFKEAKNIVAALGREDPDIIRQNYSIPYTDKEGTKKVAYPVLSTGSYTETEGKQPLPFMSDGGLTMNNQMKQFEKGGEVDPVSGNPVPLGSTAEEVRDDQPAMLSEGEMVIPADVVRYFGVEHFMKLRDEAKMGFKKMEAMGQFGTDEGQTLPDDTLFNAGGPPFTIEDIEVIEPDDVEEEEALEANVGAFVQGGQEASPFDQTFGPATNTTLANANKDPKGFLQSLGTQAFDPNDIINAIGSVNMDYLTALSPAGTNFGENKNSTRKFIDNYFTNFSKNLNAAVQQPTTAGVESESESENQDMGPTAGQGIGSMSELASAPTAANIGAAKDFTELSSTTIGIMDGLISGALNPFGSMLGPPGMIGRLGGTLSSLFSSGLSVGLPFGIGPQVSLVDPIGTGKGNIDKVATRDQQYAKALVNVADRTKQEDLELMSIVGIAQELGFDLDDIANNSNVDLVTIDNDPLGIGVAVSTSGKFGFTSNNPNDPTGGIIANPNITNTLSNAEIDKAKNLNKSFKDEIVETMQMMNDPAIDRGMGGGPQSAEAAMGFSRDEASNAEAAGAGDTDPAAAAAEAADVAAGADPAGNEAAAAAAAANAANDGTDGDDGGPDGEGGADSGPEGIAKGGLIKRKK